MCIEVGIRGIGLLGEAILYEEFPALVEAHLRKCPDTLACEEEGDELQKGLETDSASVEDVESFVRHVTSWGGRTGNRVWGTMHRDYRPEIVRRKFAQAVSTMNGLDGSSSRDLFLVQMERSADCITAVHGLSTSYGTKMLRFLRPDISGVLDSVIGQNTGCDVNNRNYGRYSYACLRAADALTERCIENPRSGSIHWRAGDVDQAIFARCNGYG